MIKTEWQNAGDAVRLATDRFKEAGIDNPRLDARLLVAGALSMDSMWVFAHPETLVSTSQSRLLGEFIDRRLKHEPVSRIMGRREFWSLDFKIDDSTLDPRPDSEILIETVLARVANRNASLSILDMGTGSGCLILALLSELKSATGAGVDQSPPALAMAAANALDLGLDNRVHFEESNWFDGPLFEQSKKFEIIISNPPYISDVELDSLAPDVKEFDPMGALSGGHDGLQAYRELLPGMAQNLAEEGFVALEIGWTQAASVEEIGNRCGLSLTEIIKDIAGRDRVLVFEQKR